MSRWIAKTVLMVHHVPPEFCQPMISPLFSSTSLSPSPLREYCSQSLSCSGETGWVLPKTPLSFSSPCFLACKTLTTYLRISPTPAPLRGSREGLWLIRCQ
uniref:Uncharacterized protein n=1 Tax=Arundo donax TaxID=35708 RepID=A0A0A9A5Q2_ARUDO